MQAYGFQGAPPDSLYGFSTERAGADRPAEKGPWSFWKVLELMRGKD